MALNTILIVRKSRSTGFVWLFILVFLISCQKAVIKPHPGYKERPVSKETKLSVIFVIHGDGSYLYHDQDGNAKFADREMVRQAIDAAIELEQEVFIFHQQPKKRILFFFSKDQSTFYHYKNGRLATKGHYARESSVASFAAEADLYRNASVRYQKSDPPDSLKTILLYYGHEIPLQSDKGYHASFSNINFSHREFASALGNFFQDKKKPIDLLVLSTCRGGNPILVSALSPLTRLLITSPENLHLSHLDANLLPKVLKPDNRSMAENSLEFARQAFQRLAERTQTVVTVALYDIGKVEAFAGSVSQQFYKLLDQNKSSVQQTIEYTQCKRDSLPETGVEIFFRAPRFGRSSTKASHSGWQCVHLRP